MEGKYKLYLKEKKRPSLLSNGFKGGVYYLFEIRRTRDNFILCQSHWYNNPEERESAIDEIQEAVRIALEEEGE